MAIVAKIPSLETRWLHRSEKWLPQPVVIWEENNCSYGGLHIDPQQGETLIDNIHVPMDRGVICIAEYDMIEATVAHEWRHHYQTCSGWRYDGKSWAATFKAGATYEDAIVQYFRQSRAEMDALLYSVKVAPNELTEEWLEWINAHEA